MIITMKVTKRTVLTIELEDHELLAIEEELNILRQSKVPNPQNIKLTRKILSTILEE